MGHEIAKLLLEHSRTFLERKQAIKSAMALGMPLNEIEQYLDWLDSIAGQKKNQTGADATGPGTGSGPGTEREPDADAPRAGDSDRP